MVGDAESEGVPQYERRERRSLTGALRDLEQTTSLQDRAQRVRHLLSELESHRTELESQNQKLRESNAALAESQSRYAELYDFAPVAYLRLDSATKILEANLTAATLFRTERGKLIDRPLSGLVAPDSRTTLRAHLRACFSERLSATAEIQLVTPRSTNVTVQITSAPLLGPDGEVVACKSTLTDVSELKRAQEVLRFLAQAGTRLACSFDYRNNVADTIQRAVPLLGDVAIADIFDGAGELERIGLGVADAKLNRLARLARDATPPSGRGTPLDWVLHTREPLVLVDCDASTFRGGTEGLVHERFVQACAPRSLAYIPIVPRGEVLGILTLMATDSGLRFGEEELSSATDLASRIGLAVDKARLYDEANRAIRMRERVLSFVSHDLKNPLMGILLSTELLLNRAPPDERRRGWKQLDRIRRGVQQMRRLVEDLLDASSIDAGRLAVNLASRRANDVFEEALELLRPIAEDKAIELKMDVPDPALELRCDRHRLIQVLYNLIGNALKFTPRSGRVTVSAERARDQLLITVQDSGPGIPPELLPRLFQPYVQHESTARHGRGLGLFISRGIVEAHGGRIWADPKPGAGATFQFTIPLASPYEVSRFSKNMGPNEATGDLPSAVAGPE